MPVYEYRCGACRRRSSHFFRTFAAVATPDCPSCGAPAEQMQNAQAIFVATLSEKNGDLGASADCVLSNTNSSGLLVATRTTFPSASAGATRSSLRSACHGTSSA